jgi:lipoprotein-anchoring transpeptidase ErfK/SrfK
MGNRARPVLSALVALTAAAALAGCAASRPSGPAAPITPPGPATTSAPPARPASIEAVQPASSPTPTTAARPVWTPCRSNTAAQLVYVSIASQHLWMCARTTPVRDTPVTTGMVGEYTNTPTGSYHVQSKQTDQTLTLNTGAQYRVRYWIPFDAPLFGFHDSSWQSFPYGSPQYRTSGSHGCIHVPLAAIAFLYGWADVGASVVITA